MRGLLELFEYFAKYANDIILLTDDKGQIVEANEQAVNIYEYSYEELIKMNIKDLRDSKKSPPYEMVLEKTGLENGYIYEAWHKRRDGTRFLVETSIRRFRVRGKFFFQLIVRDITARKCTEPGAEEAHQRLLTVLDSIAAIVYVTDMESDEILFINEHARLHFGNVVGEKCWNVLQSNQTSRCEFCTNEKLVDARGNPTGIYRWEFQNTQTGRWYDCQDRMIKWVDGRPARLEIGIDITDRKQTEEKLRESETRNRSILKAIPDLMFINNREGVFLDYHASDERLLAVDPEQFLCKPLHEVLPAKLAEKLLEVFGKAHETKQAQVIQYCLDVQGDTRHFEATVTPMDKQRQLTIVRDITGYKQVEQAIKHSLAEKETLLKEVHHRVKNNMQVISSLLNLQIIRNENKDVKQALMDCQGRINSMASVHEMLYRSTSLCLIDCQEYISKLAKDIMHSYCRPDVHRIKLKVDARGVTLGIQQASPLGLIINELLSNALKYGFPGSRQGEINISLQLHRPNVMEFVFCDNGIGIHENFDWRNTKSLGLNLIVLLAENQLGGSINLDRENGTRFLIHFLVHPAN